MACFSKDCNFVKKNGDCFYDGIPPSSSPKTCEKCMFFKPITCADRIRAMTDEELAEYLDGLCHDLWQMFVKDPQKMWLDWLKQEVKDD